MPIKAVIVGCGGIAIDHHVPSILKFKDRIQVTALVDIDLNKAKQLNKHFNAKLFSSLEDALKYNKFLPKNERFDTVILLLPHHLHKKFAVPLLNTGEYHVLLEKPIARDLNESREILRAAEKSKKIFLIAENAPHWPEVVRMEELLRSKAIGDIVTIKGYLNYPLQNHTKNITAGDNWRSKIELSGGGVVSDGGLHWIRALRVLMGEEVVSIPYAYTEKTLADIEGESFGHAILKFKSGKKAIFTIAILSHFVGEYNIFEIIGTEGHIALKSGPKGNVGYFGECNTRLMLYNREYPDGMEAMKPQGYSQSFIDEYKNFLNAIEYNEPLKVTPKSTAVDFAIALSIYQAAQLKKEVLIPSIEPIGYKNYRSTLYQPKVLINSDKKNEVSDRKKGFLRSSL